MTDDTEILDKAAEFSATVDLRFYADFGTGPSEIEEELVRISDLLKDHANQLDNNLKAFTIDWIREP